MVRKILVALIALALIVPTAAFAKDKGHDGGSAISNEAQALKESKREAAKAERELAREAARAEQELARETAKTERELAREAAKAERELAREAAKAEREAAKEQRKLEREAAKAAREAARDARDKENSDEDSSTVDFDSDQGFNDEDTTTVGSNEDSCTATGRGRGISRAMESLLRNIEHVGAHAATVLQGIVDRFASWLSQA